MFAQRKHDRKQKVCTQQLDCCRQFWQDANMRLKLKEIRKTRGLTLDQLADLSGLSKAFLSQLETGKRMPSADTLGILAETFTISITDLIDGEDDSREIVRLDELARSMSAEDLRRLVAIAETLAVQSPRKTGGGVDDP
jgi:transcriptional regulator with XRE-family HTH domain